MRILQVKPSRLQGTFFVPPSKSQTLRALVFALMAKGNSSIQNALVSPDTDAMIEAIKMFGAKVEKKERSLIVQGVGGQLCPVLTEVDAKNSGLVLRFMGALAALLPTETMLTGDFSIQNRRPVGPLLQALEQLGAEAFSLKNNGCAPIVIRGPIRKGVATLSGEDSQPVSALLIAASFLSGTTELYVTNPGEKPWVELTLSWLDRLGIRYENHGFTHFKLFGGAQYGGFSYAVPGDFSTASYPLAAAVISGSEITLENLDWNEKQGDKKVIQLLQEMGANIVQEGGSLRVKKGGALRGLRIDINDCIDALPLLAVVACFATSPTEIYNGKIARKKESDRIVAIASELKKMGACIEEREDGLLIQPSNLRQAKLFSHHDHRIVLSLLVAALGAEGESSIEDIGCTAKTYPSFFADFERAGAQIACG